MNTSSRHAIPWLYAPAGAKVVQADVAASNGVIHAINRVLMPPKKK